MAATQTASTRVVGKAQPRVDGPLKVSGRAMYASDHHFPGMLFAVPVCSTHCEGRDRIARSRALRRKCRAFAPSITGEISASFFAWPVDFGGEEWAMVDETASSLRGRHHPLLRPIRRARRGGNVRAGQRRGGCREGRPIGRSRTMSIPTSHPNVSTAHARKTSAQRRLAEATPQVKSERGDPETAFAKSPVQLDATYTLPVETHNPIELHATVAVWDGSTFTLHDATQGVVNARNVMAQMLGVPKENVRVISKFLGSGFGGKLWPWPHCALAAAAARDLNRPVKLVLSRRMMFQNVGHRPRIQQRVRLSATPRASSPPCGRNM